MIAPSELSSFTCPECAVQTFLREDVERGFCAACNTLFDTMRPDSFSPLWAIYAQPEDHPQLFVVKVFWGPWAEARSQLAGTLELARTACMMEGACRILPRDLMDEPALAEVWV